MSDQNFRRSTFHPFTYRLQRPIRPPPAAKMKRDARLLQRRVRLETMRPAQSVRGRTSELRLRFRYDATGFALRFASGHPTDEGFPVRNGVLIKLSDMIVRAIKTLNPR